jgi:hypothetical protein
MRALNIIREFEGFDVCSFVLYLYNYTQLPNHGYWTSLSAMVLLINIVLVNNYYEINKELRKMY